MKCLPIAASAVVLSFAFAGNVWAGQEPVSLSESQLDGVVAGGIPSMQQMHNDHGQSAMHMQPRHDQSMHHASNKGKDCGCGSGFLSVSNVASGNNKILNGNTVLSGNEVNVLNGNNTAIGVGVLGTGAIALRK